MSSKDSADVTNSSRRSADDAAAVDYKSVKVFARTHAESDAADGGGVGGADSTAGAESASGVASTSGVRAAIPAQRTASTQVTNPASAKTSADAESTAESVAQPEAVSAAGKGSIFSSAKSKPKAKTKPKAASKPSPAKAASAEGSKKTKSKSESGEPKAGDTPESGQGSARDQGSASNKRSAPSKGSDPSKGSESGPDAGRSEGKIFAQASSADVDSESGQPGPEASVETKDSDVDAPAAHSRLSSGKSSSEIQTGQPGGKNTVDSSARAAASPDAKSSPASGSQDSKTKHTAAVKSAQPGEGRSRRRAARKPSTESRRRRSVDAGTKSGSPEAQDPANGTTKTAKSTEKKQLAQSSKPAKDGEPSKAEKPAEAKKPAQPKKSAQATKPAQGEKPAETKKPAEAKKQVESKKLAEAKKPVQPKKPAQAEKSAESKKQAPAKKSAEVKKQVEAESAESKKPAQAEKPAESKKQAPAKKSAEVKKQVEAESAAEAKKLVDAEKPAESESSAKSKKPVTAEKPAEVKSPAEGESAVEAKKPAQAEKSAESKKQVEAESAESKKQAPAKKSAEVKKQVEAESAAEAKKLVDAEKPAESESSAKSKKPVAAKKSSEVKLPAEGESAAVSSKPAEAKKPAETVKASEQAKKPQGSTKTSSQGAAKNAKEADAGKVKSASAQTAGSTTPEAKPVQPKKPVQPREPAQGAKAELDQKAAAAHESETEKIATDQDASPPTDRPGKEDRKVQPQPKASKPVAGRRIPPVRPKYTQKPRGSKRRAPLQMQRAENPTRFATRPGPSGSSAPESAQSASQEADKQAISAVSTPDTNATTGKSKNLDTKQTPSEATDTSVESVTHDVDNDAAKSSTGLVDTTPKPAETVGNREKSSDQLPAQPAADVANEQPSASDEDTQVPSGDEGTQVSSGDEGTQVPSSDKDTQVPSGDDNTPGPRPSPLQAALAELGVDTTATQAKPSGAADAESEVKATYEDPIADAGLTPTVFSLDDGGSRTMPSLSDRVASAARRRRDSEHLLLQKQESDPEPQDEPAAEQAGNIGTPLMEVLPGGPSVSSARPLPQLRAPQQEDNSAAQGARPLPSIPQGPRPINEEALARAQAHKPKLEPLAAKRDVGVVTPATRFTRRDKPGGDSEHVSIVVGPPQLQSQQRPTPLRSVPETPSKNETKQKTAKTENETPAAAAAPEEVPTQSGPKPLPMPQQLTEFAGTIGERLAASVRTPEGESVQLDHAAVDNLASMLDEGDSTSQDYSDVLGQQAFLGSLHQDNEFAGDDVPAAANIQQPDSADRLPGTAGQAGVFEQPTSHAQQAPAQTQPAAQSSLPATPPTGAPGVVDHNTVTPAVSPSPAADSAQPAAAQVTNLGQQPLPKLPSRSVGESLAAVRATHTPGKEETGTGAAHTLASTPQPGQPQQPGVAQQPGLPQRSAAPQSVSSESADLPKDSQAAGPTASPVDGTLPARITNPEQTSGMAAEQPSAAHVSGPAQAPEVPVAPSPGETQPQAADNALSPQSEPAPTRPTISLAKKPKATTSGQAAGAQAKAVVGTNPQPAAAAGVEASAATDQAAAKELPSRGDRAKTDAQSATAADAAASEAPRQAPAVPTAEAAYSTGEVANENASAQEENEPHFRENAEIVFAEDDNAASLPTRTPKPVSKSKPKTKPKPAPRRGPDADAPVARGGFAAAFVAGAAKAAAKSDDSDDKKSVSPAAAEAKTTSDNGGGSGHWMDQMPFEPGTTVEASTPSAVEPEPEPELPRTDADLPQRRGAAASESSSLPQRNDSGEATSVLPQRPDSSDNLPTRTMRAADALPADDMSVVPDPTAPEDEIQGTPAATTERPEEVDEVGPQAAGWYDDPSEDGWQRYFDGMVWTDQRVQAVDMVSAHAAGEADIAEAVANGTTPAPVDFSNGAVTESLYDEYGEVREDTTLAALAHMTQAMPQGLADRNDVLATIDAAEVAAARAARRNIRPKLSSDKGSSPKKAALGNVVPKGTRPKAKGIEAGGKNNTIKLAVIIFVVMLFVLALLMYGVDILLT